MINEFLIGKIDPKLPCPPQILRRGVVYNKHNAERAVGPNQDADPDGTTSAPGSGSHPRVASRSLEARWHVSLCSKSYLWHLSSVRISEQRFHALQGEKLHSGLKALKQVTCVGCRRSSGRSRSVEYRRSLLTAYNAFRILTTVHLLRHS